LKRGGVKSAKPRGASPRARGAPAKGVPTKPRVASPPAKAAFAKAAFAKAAFAKAATTKVPPAKAPSGKAAPGLRERASTGPVGRTLPKPWPVPFWIAAKRDGQRLDDDILRTLVMGAATDAIPDYQTSAMLMAIVFRGLSLRWSPPAACSFR
jgi:hypothetical protein